MRGRKHRKGKNEYEAAENSSHGVPLGYNEKEKSPTGLPPGFSCFGLTSAW
jgi:hypothetical protein